MKQRAHEQRQRWKKWYDPNTGTMMSVYPAQLGAEDLPPFVVGRKFLSAQDCNRLMKGKYESLSANYASQHLADGSEVGDCKYVYPTKANMWIYAALSSQMAEVNEKYYRFAVIGFVEALRVKRYEEGQGMPWHQDFGYGDVHDQSKLSCIVQLNNKKEFVGADLEFLTYDAPSLDQGDVIVFPGLLPHKVTTVARGTRYSLAGWWNGPHYV